MCKHWLRLVIALSGFTLAFAVSPIYLTGCRNATKRTNIPEVVQERQGLQLNVPNDIWVTIFFKEIDERTKEANLPRLRSVLLPGDDVEVRIWMVVSYYGLDGIVLRRAAGQWSATYLYGVSKDPHLKKRYEKSLEGPRSGWEEFWQKLVAAGLLTLPDASEVQCKVIFPDGLGYVVETNTNKTYRTYMYGNPQFAKCNEAKQVIKIVEIINQDFGLEWSTTREVGVRQKGRG